MGDGQSWGWEMQGPEYDQPPRAGIGGPVAYCCQKHGGSQACEQLNQQRGLSCPLCKMESTERKPQT